MVIYGRLSIAYHLLSLEVKEWFDNKPLPSIRRAMMSLERSYCTSVFLNEQSRFSKLACEKSLVLTETDGSSYECVQNLNIGSTSYKDKKYTIRRSLRRSIRIRSRKIGAHLSQAPFHWKNVKKPPKNMFFSVT